MPIVFYRKYRPKQFRDVIGHDDSVTLFRAAVQHDALAHAYLLHGPRGTGKTTLARLIAKAANCLSPLRTKTGEACGTCASCTSIDRGQNMDIIEIDAASNRGIDEIRSLKEGIALAPAQLRKKVFIIDEAHMLTKDAFNALLKTLEEPPPHAIIILATTEYEKVPATIISRTQRFRLKKLATPIIVKKLQSICSQEKLRVTDDALELIALAAEGSMRDAESLLEQIGAAGAAVSVTNVEQLLGRVGYRRVVELVNHFAKNDRAATLTFFHTFQNDGFNLAEFARELIVYMRRSLALAHSPTLDSLLQKELTTEELAHIKKHSQTIPPAKQLALVKSLIRAYGEMKYSPFPVVPLEVALIENLV